MKSFIAAFGYLQKWGYFWKCSKVTPVYGTYFKLIYTVDESFLIKKNITLFGFFIKKVKIEKIQVKIKKIQHFWGKNWSKKIEKIGVKKWIVFLLPTLIFSMVSKVILFQVSKEEETFFYKNFINSLTNLHVEIQNSIFCELQMQFYIYD